MSMSLVPTTVPARHRGVQGRNEECTTQFTASVTHLTNQTAAPRLFVPRPLWGSLQVLVQVESKSHVGRLGKLRSSCEAE